MSKVGLDSGMEILKGRPKSLIAAVQNHSIRINLVKSKIDRNQKDPLCRLCKKTDVSIDPVFYRCSNFTQKQFKRRHYNQDKTVHWRLVKKCNIDLQDLSTNQKLF